MMWYRFLLLSFCVAMVSPTGATVVETAGFTYQLTSVPTWVDTVTLPQSASSTSESTQYMLLEHQRKVLDNSEQHFRRLVYSPRRRPAVASASKIHVSFNPAFQELSFHSIKVKRNGVIQDRLADADIKLLQREEELESKAIVDGTVTAVVLLSDIRVDDIIEYSYSTSGINSVLGEKHFSALQLGWDRPIDHMRLRLLVNKDRKLHYKFSSDTVDVSQRVLGAWREYSIDLYNVAGTYFEEEYPSWYTPYPWGEFSEYRSWTEVNEWALALYEPPLAERDRSIDQQVASVVDGIQLTDDQIVALIRFVQDEIRYLGIEVGENSHRPSLPSEVLTRRFGDCKDKTVLLIAMLKRLGVDAYPALVSSSYGNILNEFLPAPGQFDHVIVVFDWKGKRYWVDPTFSYQRGSLDFLENAFYEKALVVKQDETSLTDMEDDRIDSSGTEVKEHYYSASYFSPVKLVVTSTYYGRNADYQRRQFASYSVDELGHRFQNFYSQFYPSLQSLADIEYQDDETKNVFTVHERYLLDDYWNLDDENAKHFDLYGYLIQDFVSNPKTIRRTGPLGIGYPTRLGHELVLHFPEHVNFDTGDDAVKVIENDALAYRRQTTYRNNALHVKHALDIKTDHVPQEMVSKHVSHLSDIRSYLNYDGRIDGKPDKGDRAMKSLIDFLGLGR